MDQPNYINNVDWSADLALNASHMISQTINNHLFNWSAAYINDLNMED